MEENLAPAL
jgi:hypothetical protein